MAWTPARAPPAVAIPPTTARTAHRGDRGRAGCHHAAQAGDGLPARHAGNPTGEHPGQLVDGQKAGGDDPGNRHRGSGRLNAASTPTFCERIGDTLKTSRCRQRPRPAVAPNRKRAKALAA